MSASRSGFSMLEALVAVLIVGSAGMAALTAAAADLEQAGVAEYHAVATALAEQKLAEFRILRAEGQRAQTVAGSFQAPYDGYTWRARAQQQAWSVVAGLEELEVSVRWADGDVALRTRVLVPGARP